MAAKKETKPKDDQASKHEVKVEKFDRRLDVALTQDDLIAFGNRNAMLDSLIDEHEREIENIKQELKGKIESANSEMAVLEAERRANSQKIREGKKWDSVKCERRFIYRTGKVEEWRLDGDKPQMFHERGMSPEERQLQFPESEKPNGKPEENANADGAKKGTDESGIVDDDYVPEGATEPNGPPPSTPADKPARRQRRRRGEQQPDA